MPETKYGKYFIRGSKPNEWRWSYQQEVDRCIAKIDDDVIKGSFALYAHWLAPEDAFVFVHAPHTHPYDEHLFCMGFNPDDPLDFGGQFEFHLGKGFERHVITKPSVLFIPAHFVHGPMIWRLRKPILGVGYSMGPIETHQTDNELINFKEALEIKYDKYIATGPKPNETREYFKKAVTYIDDDVVKGSHFFYSTFISKENPLLELPPHINPYDQYMVFAGTNYKDRFNLGAEVEFCMGEDLEKHTFNQSTAVYIPGGLPHGPIKIKINRPFIFINATNGPRLEAATYKPSK